MTDTQKTDSDEPRLTPEPGAVIWIDGFRYVHQPEAAAQTNCLPQWQTIDNAPKSTHVGSHVTGIYILGYCPDEGATPEACISVVWWEPLLNGGVWTDGHMTVRPTHWMRLPAPPLPEPKPGD
jgi:hypothetical protein